MASLNEVSLIGNLGSKPELKYTGTGAAYARFSIATNEVWRDRKTNETKTRTDWHRVVAWGRLADVVAQHLDVGRLVCVRGSLRVNEWKDAQGARRVSVEVHAAKVVFLDGNSQRQTTTEVPPPEDVQPAGEAPHAAEDEIPF
jgi:single-strand DNA-binding protein